MALPPDLTVPEGYYPPFAVISDSDHGGWIIIATALGLALVLLSSGIRVYLRTSVRHQSGTDDAFLAVATVLAIVQEIIIFNACDQGLGRSVELLTASNLASIEKLAYTAQILAIFPFGLSKCSLAIFILRLTPNERLRRIVYGILILIVAWMAAAVLAFSLQCDLAHPWSFVGARCVGVETRILVIGLFDILFEVALFAISVSLVFSLRVALRQRMIVVLAFGMRLPIIAIVIARIISFDEARLTTNFSLAEDFYTVWTETEINYSLISTTLPVIRPLIKDLSTYYGGRWYSDSPPASRSNSYPLFAIKARPFNRAAGRQESSHVLGESEEGENTPSLGFPPDRMAQDSAPMTANIVGGVMHTEVSRQYDRRQGDTNNDVNQKAKSWSATGRVVEWDDRLAPEFVNRTV